MWTPIKQITNLSILVGASALLGCVSVQTTDEYAISHGYQPIQDKGKEYFCRLEQPVVPGEPHMDLPQRLLVRVPCFTREGIIQIRYAGTSPAPDFEQPVINGSGFDPSYNRDNPIPPIVPPPTH